MKATRRIQRRTNMNAILHRCTLGSHTVSELAEAASITRPAAEAVVTDLIELGWIQIAPPPEEISPLGRPATYYALSPSAGAVAALDIGAHHISVAIADLAGTSLAEKHIPESNDTPIDQRVKTAVTLLMEVAPSSAPIRLCAVGTPGIHHQGTVTYYGGSGMPGLQGYNLEEVFNHSLNIPIITAGDCSLAARGESWKGAASTIEHVVFILAGHRTGAASVINGRVHGGLSGSAGLIGELPAIRWRELEDEHFAQQRYGGKQPTRDEIFTKAQEGDPRAQSAVSDYAYILAQGAAAMILAIAPEAVVIGGQYSVHADLFLDTFTTELERICPFMPQITTSTLRERAVTTGGIRFALDAVFDQISHHVNHSDYFPAANAVFDAQA